MERERGTFYYISAERWLCRRVAVGVVAENHHPRRCPTPTDRLGKVGYQVNTPVFEGPFDLLLHLVTREQVDIW